MLLMKTGPWIRVSLCLTVWCTVIINLQLLSFILSEKNWTTSCCVQGFITDGNSKLVGNARLRQLRVQQNSCQIAGPVQQFVPDCNALYSWEAEDMGSYDPGWNHSVKNNISKSISRPWRYQTQAQLRAYHIWGTLALYRAGGFVAELGPDLQNASRCVQ